MSDRNKLSNKCFVQECKLLQNSIAKDGITLRILKG